MQKRDIYGNEIKICGVERLYREIGYHVARHEQYDRSLIYFNKAVENADDDIRALIGRSKSRAKAMQYDGAMEDINRAHEINPDSMDVLANKAMNTYLCGHFEDGLIQNIRLAPIRKQPEVFKLGTMQCSDAIENCIGERAGRPLRDHFKEIRNIAWHRNFEAQKPYTPVPNKQKKKLSSWKHLLELNSLEESEEPKQPKTMKGKYDLETGLRDSLESVAREELVVPPYHLPYKFAPMQKHSSNIENFMAEKYLDHMYLDKIFLKQIVDNPGLGCPNEKVTAKLKKIVRHCYKDVAYKQESLRARRPFYFIKYQKVAHVSRQLEKRQKNELQLQQRLIRSEANIILEKMLALGKQKKLRACLAMSETLMRYCDSKTKKFLPNKLEYMQTIYRTVCQAYYDMFRVNKKLSPFEQHRTIYAVLGIPLSREVSKDSVIKELKQDSIKDHKRQIGEFETRLENAVLPEEICFFYHQLARFHLDQKNFHISKIYAKKCIQQAKTIENHKWIFNSSMLLCKGNLQQQNKNDARSDVILATKAAAAMKDQAKVDYLGECLNVIEKVRFDDVYGAEALKKRETKILEIMPQLEMKQEFSHLFKQMEAMPTSRRMTVMPGIKVSQTGQAIKSRHMSIMPTAHSKATHNSLKELRLSGKSSVKGDNLTEYIQLRL